MTKDPADDYPDYVKELLKMLGNKDMGPSVKAAIITQLMDMTGTDEGREFLHKHVRLFDAIADILKQPNLVGLYGTVLKFYLAYTSMDKFHFNTQFLPDLGNADFYLTQY